MRFTWMRAAPGRWPPIRAALPLQISTQSKGFAEWLTHYLLATAGGDAGASGRCVCVLVLAPEIRFAAKFLRRLMLWLCALQTSKLPRDLQAAARAWWSLCTRRYVGPCVS